MARLSAGTLAVAVVAVLLALTGAFTVRQFLEQREEAAAVSAPAKVDEVLIPVAVTDLEPGRLIRESDFANIKMSRPDFSKSKYAQKAFVNRVEQLKGRVLRTEILTGSTVGPNELYAEGTGPTVAEKLPQGMRAVTVKVSGAGFADGFASPGTFVDVLFRSSGIDENTKDIPETTITAMTRVEVLAVDTTPYPQSKPEVSRRSSDTQEARVTFAVKPSQATMLKALEDRGEISLALRPLAEAGEMVAENAQKNDDASPVDRHAQTVMQILEGVKATPIVVATTELTEGRVVRPGDIRLVEAEEVDADPSEVVTYGNIETLVGRTLRTGVTAGQVITADILYPEGVSPGVADRLPRGFRAVTVNMSKAALVDGFVSPGTEVDVFFRAEALEGYPETTLRVLDGLKVLAIEDRVSPGSDADSKDAGTLGVRVTLAVPLGEVGRIQALEGHGTMTLAVRAVGERPIGEIARELETTREQLERTQQHIAALQQISQLDDSIQLSKEQTDRLAALMSELPLLERKMAALSEEKDAATTGVSQTTLAEVLNLPEPARPTRLDIFNGGSRETLVFNAGSPASSISRTASRVNENTTKASNSTPKDKSSMPVGPVKQASDTQEVDVENVSVVIPDRKVSDVSTTGFRDVNDLRATGGIASGQSSVIQFGNSTNKASLLAMDVGRTSIYRRDVDQTLMSAVTDFGRGLVNGLSKATLPGQRVEIVRGGVKE
jgi:pilus assembly protein CpaB